MQYAIKHDAKWALEDCDNYAEVRAAIAAKLEALRDAPAREEPPLIYHLDVAAMYPNIILTNRCALMEGAGAGGADGERGREGEVVCCPLCTLSDKGLHEGAVVCSVITNNHDHTPTPRTIMTQQRQHPQPPAVGDRDRRGLRGVRLQPPRQELPAHDGLGERRASMR